jgi:hypothetical protein
MEFSRLQPGKCVEQRGHQRLKIREPVASRPKEHGAELPVAEPLLLMQATIDCDERIAPQLDCVEDDAHWLC